MPSENGQAPGRFESPLEEFPGYFTLPAPFTEAHLRAWFDLAIKPIKGKTLFDYEFYDGEWQAAVKLIRDFGEWHIEGVKPGELDGGTVPAQVKKWALQEVSEYVYPFLPPRMLVVLSGIT